MKIKLYKVDRDLYMTLSEEQKQVWRSFFYFKKKNKAWVRRKEILKSPEKLKEAELLYEWLINGKN